MASTPSINDRKFNLLFKIAQNWYNKAISLGLSGVAAPSRNDTRYDLMVKVCYYTAFVAENP